MSAWKRDFASGLIVLVPLIVTAWVIIWLYGFLQSLIPSGVLFDDVVLDLYLISVAIHSVTEVLVVLALFSLLVLATGYLMRTAAGSLVEASIDNAMNHLPGLRIVYNASKMAIETAISDSTSLQEPVKLHTWENIRMTAFKTGRNAPDGRVLLFLPTAPNITSGFVIEVEEADIIEIDESVEDALTRILSAGFGEKNTYEEVQIAVDSERDEDPATIPIEHERSETE